MKQMLFALAVVAATAPALAQDAPSPPAGEQEGFSLIQEGLDLIMRGFITEVEPALTEMGKALEELRPAIEELGPKFKELIALVGDFSNYSAPEVLPNGDIIIRRTTPLPEAAPGQPVPVPVPEGQIEL
jgi:hypothetical protein